MEQIQEEVRQTLRENVDEKTRLTGRRVFKEEVRFYGVKVSVHRIAREFFPRVEGLSKRDIFHLCEELWKSGINEEQWVSCDWSFWIKERYEPADFEVFEGWLHRYVNNWASCDALCNHTIGELVERFPEYVAKLKIWARSENRWVRRGAAVTLIIPARKGLFLDDIFEIAGILLTDPDDLVQKGYGWMLKAASQAHPDEVFAYVMGKKDSMPRTAYRYALEKMPKEWRAEAMKK